MILIAAALACVASVPLTGGRLGRLADLRLRRAWVAIGSLVMQVVIVSVAPAGATGLHAVAHVASYALAGACLVANRHIAGLPVLALGAVLNTLAIVANGGVMPASASAMRVAGLAPAEHFANSAAVAHPRLLLLGDVIPVPGPWPLGNVLSVGDLLILAGLLLILHVGCRPARPPLTPGDTEAAPSGRGLVSLGGRATARTRRGSSHGGPCGRRAR